MGVVPEYKKVYLWTGRAHHLVQLGAPRLPGDQIPERYSAVCGFRPGWPGGWYEPMNEEEREKLESLRVCGKCSMMVGEKYSVRSA